MARKTGVPGSSEKPQAERRHLMDWSRHPLIVLGSFVFAIVSLGISGLSFLLAQQSRSEEKAVVLDVYPSVRSADVNETDAGLRVVLVNQSLRRIVIREAALWMGDCEIGRVDQWLPDVAIFDRRFVDPAWSERILEMPVTVEARHGSAIALFVPYSLPCLDTTTKTTEADFARSRRVLRLFRDAIHLFPPYNTAEAVQDLRLRLRLVLAPGGVHVTPVRIAPGMSPGVSWQQAYEVVNSRFEGINFRRKLAEPGQVDILSLDVWREGTSFHRRVTRPLVGDEFTLFPLKSLPPGRYIYVFAREGTGVSGGRIILPPIPCRDPPIESRPCYLVPD
jgi:hypothetical protein